MIIVVEVFNNPIFYNYNTLNFNQITVKHMKKVFVAIALVIGMTSVMQAQESKIAHINTQALVEAMPSYVAANAELEKSPVTDKEVPR